MSNLKNNKEKQSFGMAMNLNQQQTKREMFTDIYSDLMILRRFTG